MHKSKAQPFLHVLATHCFTGVRDLFPIDSCLVVHVKQSSVLIYIIQSNHSGSAMRRRHRGRVRVSGRVSGKASGSVSLRVRGQHS